MGIEEVMSRWFADGSTEATDAIAMGAHLVFRTGPEITSDTIYYDDIFAKAADEGAAGTMLAIALEYLWLSLPPISLELDYEIFDSTPNIKAKTWHKKPERSSNPNVGLPVTSERYSVSGHSYSGTLPSATNAQVAPAISKQPPSTPADTAEDLSHPTFSLNRNLLKIVERIFSTGDDQGRQGKVSWKDIITVCSFSP
jgi:hypothetical protein